MAPTLLTDRTAFWQQHVDAWQSSGLTRKAYCLEQGLRYSSFGYWVRKLREAEAPPPSAGFVPVALAEPHTMGLSLALPSGVEIRGIEQAHLRLVRELLEVLA
ncbi:MAG: hypothetical protein D6720_10530 [Gammaproteobacteria bacterium]|nr:MAG: hypothetical protein D6720_10530 [Gammaproteobacteria bacterium]